MHLTFSPLEPDHRAETAQRSLSLTLAGPSQWPENPHPWAIWLVAPSPFSTRGCLEASSALPQLPTHLPTSE